MLFTAPAATPPSVAPPSVAVHVELVRDASAVERVDLADGLARAVAGLIGGDVQVDDTTAACSDSPTCVAEVQARRGVQDVLLVRVIGGLTRLRIAVDRYDGKQLVGTVQADFPHERDTWEHRFAGLARILYAGLAEDRAGAPTAVATPPPDVRYAGWVWLGAAVVTAAGGGVLRGSSNALRTRIATEPMLTEERDSNESSAMVQGVLSNILIGLGVGAATIGVWELVTD